MFGVLFLEGACSNTFNNSYLLYWKITLYNIIIIMVTNSQSLIDHCSNLVYLKTVYTKYKASSALNVHVGPVGIRAMSETLIILYLYSFFSTVAKFTSCKNTVPFLKLQTLQFS